MQVGRFGRFQATGVFAEAGIVHDVAEGFFADFALANAGVAIEDIECNSHDIVRELPSPNRAVVTLDPEEKVPNRDFVLRYRVAGDQIK